MAERIIESLYQWWYEAPVGARSPTENVGALAWACRTSTSGASPPSAGAALALSLARFKLSPRGEADLHIGNESLQAIRLVPNTRHGAGELR